MRKDSVLLIWGEVEIVATVLSKHWREKSFKKRQTFWTCLHTCPSPDTIPLILLLLILKGLSLVLNVYLNSKCGSNLDQIFLLLCSETLNYHWLQVFKTQVYNSTVIGHNWKCWFLSFKTCYLHFSVFLIEETYFWVF